MNEAFAATTSHAEHAVPGPDKALLYSGINFVILVVVLFLVARKPAKAFFKNRSFKLRTKMADADKAHREAHRQLEIIEARLKCVDAEKRELIRDFKSEAESEKIKMVQDAREYALKIEEDAKRIASHEVQKAKQLIKEETVRLCDEIVRQKIKTEVTDADLDRLGARFVAEIQKVGLK
jgi:F-type H+-transporting ATPase subunit b